MKQLCITFIFIAVAACGQVAVRAEDQSIADQPPSTVNKLIRVPLTRQATDYTCGAAALQSVLGYYGDEIREGSLAKQLKSNSKIGTRYVEMERFAKQKGYAVEPKREMELASLQRYIDAGTPVICLIQAWAGKKVDYKTDWEDGHYVVAVGYDEKNMYFMDPSTLGNYTFIPIGEFLDRWHDRDGKTRLNHFGMTVSKGKAVFNRDEVKLMQ